MDFVLKSTSSKIIYFNECLLIIMCNTHKFLKILTINSIFVIISILMKSNLSERCLVNALMNINNDALRNYLTLACIYDGNSNKKKIDLIKMIVYGYMNGKLSKEPLKDISVSTAMNVLKDRKINIKSLPGYGNSGLKKKEILNKNKSECSIKLSA